MVGKFGELPHGSYGMCQVATGNFCVPNQGVLFLPLMPNQFLFWCQVIWCRKTCPTDQNNYGNIPLRCKQICMSKKPVLNWLNPRFVVLTQLPQGCGNNIQHIWGHKITFGSPTNPFLKTFENNFAPLTFLVFAIAQPNLAKLICLDKLPIFICDISTLLLKARVHFLKNWYFPSYKSVSPSVFPSLHMCPLVLCFPLGINKWIQQCWY